RQADGLDAYRRAHQYLAEELGVEPGSGLRHLEHAILVQDPSLDVSANRQPIIVEVPPPVDPVAGATSVVPSGSALRGKERPRRGQGKVPPPPPAIRRKSLASVPRRSVILLAALVVLASLAFGVTTAVRGRPPSLAAVRGDAM